MVTNTKQLSAHTFVLSKICSSREKGRRNYFIIMNLHESSWKISCIAKCCNPRNIKPLLTYFLLTYLFTYLLTFSIPGIAAVCASESGNHMGKIKFVANCRFYSFVPVCIFFLFFFFFFFSS